MDLGIDGRVALYVTGVALPVDGGLLAGI